MRDNALQLSREALRSCETALATLHPLLFRHKQDFGELQIGIVALGKAKAALEAVLDVPPPTDMDESGVVVPLT